MGAGYKISTNIYLQVSIAQEVVSWEGHSSIRNLSGQDIILAV